MKTDTEISKSDKPAYPTNARMHSDAQGLTKRELFAMAAMQGLCSNSVPGSHHSPVFLVDEAIEIADELLKQLDESTWGLIRQDWDEYIFNKVCEFTQSQTQQLREKLATCERADRIDSNSFEERCSEASHYTWLDDRNNELEEENTKLRDLLENIDAWLSFNMNPQADQLLAMQKSIKSILNPK